MPLAAQHAEKMVWDERPAGVRVLSDDSRGVRLRLTVPGALFLKKEAGGESFVELNHPGMTYSQQPGCPALPVFRRLLTLPAGGEAVVEKVYGHTRQVALKDKFHGAKLFPRQPSLPKTVPQLPRLKIDRTVYARDAWTGDSLVTLRTVGTMRGRKLVLLTIAPFRYNPVKDLLEVTDEVEVSIRITGTTTKSAVSSLSSPVFNATESLLGSQSVTTAGEGLVQMPIRYIILTDTLFRPVLKDFIRWKTREGYRVEVVCKGDSGVGSTADSIKSYLRNLYLSSTPDDPPPSFLLIVGDTPQIPPSANPGRVTDLYYATYDGDDDYLPDLYYGRLPARDTAELRIMLDKILEYEQYTFPDPSFLAKAVMVAGVDGTYASRWGNGQINYATGYYVNAAHGYDPSVYLYPASGGSSDAILQDISDGVSLVNYTGHGLNTGWQNPAFTISDIGNLQNTHKYPLIITNGCETASFGLDECFGEALVRARDKGAVAYIGCSDDSYWDEDFYWAVGIGPIVTYPGYEETSRAAYDRLFHDHGEAPGEWYITAGQIIFAGNMQVTEGSPSRAELYWQIYHLFGDPSMMPWLAVPAQLEVYVPATLPAGATSLKVLTAPHSYIGVTCNDTLLAAALSDEEGQALLTLPALPDSGSLLVTVTHQNRIPARDTVHIVSGAQPYLTLENIALDDSAGNGDGMPDNGETISLDVTLKNSGTGAASSFFGKLQSESPWVTVTDSLTEILSLDGSETMELYHTFRFVVRDSIPDGARVVFHLALSDTSGLSWDIWFPLTLRAPRPVILKLRVDDKRKGNGNFRLDAGEQVDFVVEAGNEGHALLPPGQALFTFTDTLVVDARDSVVTTPVAPGEIAGIPFSVAVDPAAPYGARLQIVAHLLAGGYQVSDTFWLPIGVVYDDFESGGFNAYPWHNDVNYPWVVTSGTAFSGEMAATSGAIGDSQSSILLVECEVLEDDSVSFWYKVSSEANYDKLYFYIDGTEQGNWSGELPWTYVSFPVSAGTHTFTWKYAKDGNTANGFDRAWIDYVVFPRGSFSDVDAGVTAILSPVTAPDLQENEHITVVVKNFGADMLSVIPLTLRVNDLPPLQDTLREPLVPGDTAHFTFSEPMDMMVLKAYRLNVATDLPDDKIPLNNGEETVVFHEGTIDVVVDSLLAPNRDSAYTAYEEIIVRVINNSTGALDSFPLFYQIDDNDPVFQVFNTVLPAGDTARMHFGVRADLADTGAYYITVYAALSQDVNHTNDTLTVRLYNKVLGNHPPVLTGKVLLYPNPATGHVIFKPSFSGTDWTLTLLDMSGRKWLVKQNMHWSAGEEITVPLDDLAPGMYILILTDGTRRVSLPFIKR